MAVHLLVRTDHIRPVAIVQGQHQTLHRVPLEGEPGHILHDHRHVVEEDEEAREHEHVSRAQHPHKSARLQLKNEGDEDDDDEGKSF